MNNAIEVLKIGSEIIVRAEIKVQYNKFVESDYDIGYNGQRCYYDWLVDRFDTAGWTEAIQPDALNGVPLGDIEGEDAIWSRRSVWRREFVEPRKMYVIAWGYKHLWWRMVDGGECRNKRIVRAWYLAKGIRHGEQILAIEGDIELPG